MYSLAIHSDKNINHNSCPSCKLDRIEFLDNFRRSAKDNRHADSCPFLQIYSLLV